ncbi:MAG: hypothetical protein J5798_03400 [Spirochaetaceae bacterium]|nr:hypothetical protein [Spirochaetaceae bacterium]
MKRKFYIIIYLFILAVITSCGGGGGGGGAVSYAPNSNTPHNGGDAGGWGNGNQTGGGMGGTSIEESNATLLLGQSAALSYQKVDIDLIVNGEHFAINNVTATTTTDVLPKIPIGASVSGTAIIYLADGNTRIAQLEMTEIGLHNNLVFKVPYNYTCYNLTGSQVASGTYFSRDGIDLSSVTTDSMSGWQCINDGTIHNGSYVTGVRGDIQLYALPAAGVPILTAIPDKTELIAGTSTAGDYTATITIINAASTPMITPSNAFLANDAPTVDPSDPTKYTAVLRIAGGSNATMFDDDTTVSVNIAVGSESRDVTFTLKNKYTVEIQDATHAVELGTFMQGSPLTFAAAESASRSANMIPNGREAVAFKYGSSLVLYKNASFGATSVNISSSSFTGLSSRTIYLDPVLDFTISGVSGGDTFVAGQDGTAAHPYLLRYSGTDTPLSMITFTISDSTGTITPSPSPNRGVRADTSGGTSYIAIDNNRFTIGSIPAEGVPFTVTYTDSGTGATKVINVKVVKPPVIPDFTIQITPPTSHVGTKGDPSNGKYALVNLSDTFEFTPVPAVGTSFPDGTTFVWTVLVGSASPQTLTPNTAVGESCSKSPADLGLTDAVIGRSLTTATSISVSCTAINSDPDVTDKSATSLPSDTVYAFLLYTIPAFTISVAPTSYDANNTSTSGGVTTYALTSASTSIDLTATSSSAAFPAGTTFDWTVGTTSLTGDAQHDSTESVNPNAMGITLSSSSATPTSIVITCTAKNANATADLDATDFTLKLFLLTIPAYKITIIPPAGINTGTTPGGDTVYLLINSELNDQNKKFRLRVEPENNSDSFPTGTVFDWTYGGGTGRGLTQDVTAYQMCGISNLPPSPTTPYEITCTASISGVTAPTSASAYVFVQEDSSVIDVTIANLPGYLTTLSGTSAANPCKLNITGLTASNIGQLRTALKAINNATDKYVDLSHTTLPSDLTNMDSCFQWCNRITALPAIPAGVTSMRNTCDHGNGDGCTTGSSTLKGTSVIRIPATVTDMNKTFNWCTSLQNVKIIIESTSVTNWNRTFGSINASQNVTVYVPTEAVKTAIINGGGNNGVTIVVGLP